MLDDLIKIADELDKKGHNAEASAVDLLIRKNAETIKKISGPKFRYPEMEHETHTPMEESPGFMEYEAEQELKRDMDAALNLAEKIIMGATPSIITKDKEDSMYELADMLIGSEHMNTVHLLNNFINNGYIADES